MEYIIRNEVINEMVLIAQEDTPEGMFGVCLEFVIEIVMKIKNLSLIHNNRLHKSLL